MSADDDAVLSFAGLSEEDVAGVLELVAGTEIVELDVSVSGGRLMLRRAASEPPLRAAGADGGAAVQSEPTALAVSSPLVGIFHPVVKVGDAISHGQPIGAIEALGMPTTVDAPQEGTIEELLVRDGAPVEYGQPLVLLRRGG